VLESFGGPLVTHDDQEGKGDLGQDGVVGSCSESDTHRITRREFVATVGTVTGAAIFHFPILTDESITSHQVRGIVVGTSVPLSIRINSVNHELSLDPRVTLLDLLREGLAMTGTKKGCDHGQCGACTVMVNGRRINSCLSLAVTHDGDEISTIEGLSQGNDLHPLQTAFLEYDGFQCGYCTPGQICSAVAMLNEAKAGAASYVTTDIAGSRPAKLTVVEIRERMSGNICRCGAYPGIVQAIQSVYEKS
jgi:xanthine dehydrogenase YagT iron-sulfur-binding subunit